MSAAPEGFMAAALQLAEVAEQLGEVPVGAVVVKDGEIVGRGYNQPISSCDPTAHAEMVALRDAASHLGNYRLNDCDLFVTIEPCAMCAGAIVHARIGTLYFGALEPKAGAVVSSQRFLESPWLNHQVQVVDGLLEPRCRDILQQFFKNKRSR